MLRLIKQWKQDEFGNTVRDYTHLVISLGGEHSIVIQWSPFRVSYNSFAGCA